MSGTSTLMALKAQNEGRLAEEKKIIERKRNAAVLVQHYLMEAGYLKTAQSLMSEGGLTIGKFEAADNVDLQSIIQEFEEFQEMKFGRKPKMIRKKIGSGNDDNNNSSSISGGNRRTFNRKSTEKKSITDSSSNNNNNNNNNIKKNNTNNDQNKDTDDQQKESSGKVSGAGEGGLDMSLTGTSCLNNRNNNDINNIDNVENRLLRPLPLSFKNDPDLKGLAETISRDIFQENPNVLWDDIVGLEKSKSLLKEAVVMPVKYPQLFKGLLSPWAGILLYGPPGTGKTMLAKAVASQCRTTFFNISASSIVSKYRGDSEKLIRILFELARYHAPSTIFIDEIDSLMSHRGGDGGSTEHEGSRRMKTELLIQMDGLAKTDDLVFVLAASNLPWELDLAFLRRLEKRVLVPMPSENARNVMLEKLIPSDRISADICLEDIAKMTEGYSGADIRLLCKEAAMRPMRRLMEKLEQMEIENEMETRKKTTTANNKIQQKRNKISDESIEELIASDLIDEKDIIDALETTKATQSYTEKYLKWQEENGST